MAKLQKAPGDAALAEHIERLAAIIRGLPIDPNLWQVRNMYWKMLHTVLPEFRTSPQDEGAREFVKHFIALGEQLNFAPRHLQA